MNSKNIVAAARLHGRGLFGKLVASKRCGSTLEALNDLNAKIVKIDADFGKGVKRIELTMRRFSAKDGVTFSSLPLNIEALQLLGGVVPSDPKVVEFKVLSAAVFTIPFEVIVTDQVS